MCKTTYYFSQRTKFTIRHTRTYRNDYKVIEVRAKDGRNKAFVNRYHTRARRALRDLTLYYTRAKQSNRAVHQTQYCYCFNAQPRAIIALFRQTVIFQTVAVLHNLLLCLTVLFQCETSITHASCTTSHLTSIVLFARVYNFYYTFSLFYRMCTDMM